MLSACVKRRVGETRGPFQGASRSPLLPAETSAPSQGGDGARGPQGPCLPDRSAAGRPLVLFKPLNSVCCCFTGGLPT